MNRFLLACLVLITAATTFADRAQAQSVTELDRYRPAELATDGFGVGRPTDQGHLQFGARLELSYAHDPLVVEVRTNPSSFTHVVEHQLVLHGVFSLGLFNRLILTAGLPTTLWSAGEIGTAMMYNIPVADGTALGDAWLGARVRIWGERTDRFAIGAAATVTFPTAKAAADGNAYSGQNGFSGQFRLLGEGRIAPAFRISFELGVNVRNHASLAYASLGHALTYGVDFAFPIVRDEAEDRVVLHANMRGSLGNLAEPGESESLTIETLFGAKYHHQSGLRLGLAAGPGYTRGIGTPDARALLMVGWATPQDPPVEESHDADGDGILDDVDQCPNDPEDRDGFEDDNGCPDPDNDGDGILDAADRCPLEAETVNRYEDTDGCPDEVPDTDGDGILDNVDQCVNEPEDRDNHQDEDGCPDPDNDGDTVLDANDQCPDVAGVPANRGCPDTDRDNDTVVDRLDNCPDEAGTPANHGCRERQRVIITENELEITETIYFQFNRARIERRSNALLANVANVLNAHPELSNITVEGHTDSQGNADYNRDLSMRRAQSVMRWLIDHGVAESRLTAIGYGPDRPLVPNASSAADHAKNRRVVFRITQAPQLSSEPARN